jgi:hypothetical protein
MSPAMELVPGQLLLILALHIYMDLKISKVDVSYSRVSFMPCFEKGEAQRRVAAKKAKRGKSAMQCLKLTSLRIVNFYLR